MVLVSLPYILRMDIKHTPEAMLLPPQQYITNILSSFTLPSCPLGLTTIDPKSLWLRPLTSNKCLSRTHTNSWLDLLCIWSPELVLMLPPLCHMFQVLLPILGNVIIIQIKSSLGILLELMLCLLSRQVLLHPFLCL